MLICESRPVRSGVRRRRYKCSSCEERETTYEITKDRYEKLQKLSDEKLWIAGQMDEAGRKLSEVLHILDEI